jgi:hypothetical protein
VEASWCAAAVVLVAVVRAADARVADTRGVADMVAATVATANR